MVHLLTFGIPTEVLEILIFPVLTDEVPQFVEDMEMRDRHGLHVDEVCNFYTHVLIHDLAFGVEVVEQDRHKRIVVVHARDSIGNFTMSTNHFVVDTKKLVID
jgi:hypothetical protein